MVDHGRIQYCRCIQYDNSQFSYHDIPWKHITYHCNSIYSIVKTEHLNKTQSIEMCPSWLTVKAAVFCTKLKQFAVSLHRRTENKHTRVEAVRPAGVGSSWQLLSVKQLIYIWKHLGSRKQTNGQTRTHTRAHSDSLSRKTNVCLTSVSASMKTHLE